MSFRTFLIACLVIVLVGVLGWLWLQGGTGIARGPSATSTPSTLTLDERAYAALPGSTITMPERADVAFTIEAAANGRPLGATYQSAIDPSDKAFLTFGEKRFTAIFGKVGANTYFAMPFYVNYGGTGTFLYVGLFSLSDGNELSYHDAVMIDDRVPVVSLASREDGTVKLSFRTREAGQGMATEPTTPAFAIFTRTGSDLIETMVGVNAEENAVVVASPRAGSEVPASFSASGTARAWYFEASFGIRVTDQNGTQIGTGLATAEADWMTAEPVPFKAEVKTSGYSGPAWLVFMKDNPSGLPKNDASISIPINIE